MRITKKKKITVEVASRIICDICGRAYDVGKGNDDMEIQEFVRVHTMGGYMSIFGDEEKIDADICQYCFKENIMDKIKNR